jgi:hypothetical protein
MKKDKQTVSKSRLLSMARRRLGIGSTRGGKRVVFEAVAKSMGVSAPAGKVEGYKLLARYCGMTPVPTTGTNQKFAPSASTVTADVNSLAFLESYEWRRLRMEVLVKRGARCECCGATPKDGLRMHVDHIKPRRLFPALALDESNLQVLCEVCNHGKGNWDQTDWRPKAEPIPAVMPMPVDPMRPRLVKRA